MVETHKQEISILNRLYVLFKSGMFKQAIFYTFVGAIATAVDWSSFYILNLLCNVDYKVAVSVSFTLGSAVNYILNKKITFNDRTKQIAAQLSIFAIIGVISLLMSVFIMFVQVKLMGMLPMPARIVTTGIMLTVNFLMHKYITFNQKIYAVHNTKSETTKP